MMRFQDSFKQWDYTVEGEEKLFLLALPPYLSSILSLHSASLQQIVPFIYENIQTHNDLFYYILKQSQQQLKPTCSNNFLIYNRILLSIFIFILLFSGLIWSVSNIEMKLEKNTHINYGFNGCFFRCWVREREHIKCVEWGKLKDFFFIFHFQPSLVCQIWNGIRNFSFTQFLFVNSKKNESEWIAKL